MLKLLLALIFSLSFFAAANAQTHADSVSNHAPTDSLVKSVPVDSLKKYQPVDSVAKHITIDSMAKHPHVDSVVKHLVVDSVSKPAHSKTVVKHSAIEIAVKHSPVKTMSDTRYNAYLKGEDLDSMALVGELNHFPLPDRVLKFKKQLDLSPIQVGQLNKLAADLHHKKVEMGAFIIKNEETLDNLFHARHLDEGSIIFYTNRSGLYFGELRGAILMACYNAEKLLTEAQIQKLESLEKSN